jgi:hypothetical protein
MIGRRQLFGQNLEGPLPHGPGLGGMSQPQLLQNSSGGWPLTQLATLSGSLPSRSKVAVIERGNCYGRTK